MKNTVTIFAAIFVMIVLQCEDTAGRPQINSGRKMGIENILLEIWRKF